MPHGSWRKAGGTVIAVGMGGLLLLGVEVLLAIPGPDDHFRNPAPTPVRFDGPGSAQVYVVLGDSTAAGRGGPYAAGIAMGTARHLSQSRATTLINLAVSGAKVPDVVRVQLPAALRLRPDVVLLAVGANDATHFTPAGEIESGLTAILRSLSAARPGVRVVLTGAPAVGTVRRFAQPLRWVAGRETDRVNRIVDKVIRDARNRHERVVLAPIARETGPLFARNAGLFAPDRFHPNEWGYATWLPILNRALDGVSGE